MHTVIKLTTLATIKNLKPTKNKIFLRHIRQKKPRIIYRKSVINRF